MCAKTFSNRAFKGINDFTDKKRNKDVYVILTLMLTEISYNILNITKPGHKRVKNYKVGFISTF